MASAPSAPITSDSDLSAALFALVQEFPSATLSSPLKVLVSANPEPDLAL